MDERGAHRHRDRRGAGDCLPPRRRPTERAQDHLGRPLPRRPPRPVRQRPTSAWYRGAQVRHQGRISAGGIDKDVTFEDADHDLDDALDAVYRDKYRRYSPATLDRITSPEARSTTIRLVPS
jgi:hypothetical protein